MSDALYAGAAVRRLRRREGLTQSAMAARLSVSPSYLNLIERNRRPLSAQVVVRLVDSFEFDPRALKDDPVIGGVDGLMRRFADPRLTDLAVDREEAEEFLSASPRAAAALARLFDETPSAGPSAHSLSAYRAAIEKWQNHFPDLDAAAEQLADEVRLTSPDMQRGIVDRLRDRHQLSLRILPLDVIGERDRGLDYHARQVQLSEMLSLQQRQFQLARQLVELELHGVIAPLANTVDSDDPAIRTVFADHVGDYAATALLLPYGRFLRACEQTGYDHTVLQARFSVDFETLASRLTTLQRTGHRGLPFFSMVSDGAGQVARFVAGASRATFPVVGTLCPLWTVHDALVRPDAEIRQRVIPEGAPTDMAEWITVSRSARSAGGAMRVVTLGLQASLASDTQTGKLVGDEAPTPIGPGCAQCRRTRCHQRAYPATG